MNYKGTQRNRLLEALKLGPVNSYDATYSLGFKQAPTRIKELKELGHNITSSRSHGRSVDWVLRENNVRKTYGGSDSISAPKSPSLQDGHFCGSTYRFYLAETCGYCQPVQERMGV